MMMNKTRQKEQRPLRVLVVSEFPYKGIVIGGVQSSVEILVRALSRMPEIEKVLLLSFMPSLKEDCIEHWNEKLTIHYAVGQKRLLLPTRAFLDYRKAKRVAEAFCPDVVHGQETDGHGDVAQRLGYPNVLTIHGVGTFEAELCEQKNKLVGPLRILLTKKAISRIMRNSAVVISISEFDRQYCTEQGAARVISIPNAVRYEFVEMQPEFPSSHRIVFNGVIIPRKNVTGLVRAFTIVKKHVPDAILDIVGPVMDSAYHKEIMKNIDSSVKDSIMFHGNKQVKELTQLIKNASVAVLFSIYENLPVAVAEAFMLGKPVVSSRVGGLGDMVRDGETGFLVESEDEDALADRLVRLLQDPLLRRQMGMRAREIATKKWNPESVAADTVGAYRLAVESA